MVKQLRSGADYPRRCSWELSVTVSLMLFDREWTTSSSRMRGEECAREARWVNGEVFLVEVLGHENSG